MNYKIILLLSLSSYLFSCTKDTQSAKYTAGNSEGFVVTNQNVQVTGSWQSSILLDLDLDNQIDLAIESTYSLYEYPEFINSTFTIKNSPKYTTNFICFNDSLYFVELSGSNEYYRKVDTSYMEINSIILRHTTTRTFNVEEPNSTLLNRAHTIKTFQPNESAKNAVFTNTNGIFVLRNSSFTQGSMGNYINANPGDTVSTTIQENEAQIGSINLTQIYHIPFKIKKNGSFHLGWIEIMLSDTNKIHIPKTLFDLAPLD